MKITNVVWVVTGLYFSWSASCFTGRTVTRWLSMTMRENTRAGRAFFIGHALR